MPDPVIDREEADAMVAWMENLLTVAVTPWQRQVLAMLIMHPDVPLTLGYHRD